MATEDDLKELVVGVTDDVYRAERCAALVDGISDQSKRLNDENFGDLFGSIQGVLVNELIMALSRTYEHPGRRYPNRSLRTTVRFIEDNADELIISNRELLIRGLRLLAVSEDKLHDISDQDLNRLTAQTCQGLFPNAHDNLGLEEALTALRAIRDKQIAHHEQVDADKLPKTTWGAVDQLLAVPKKIVGIVGDAYLNTAYVDMEGNYILTNDAERASIALNRLFKKAGMIDAD